MPARSIDTASISFGLVAIPVRVFSTGEPSHELHFHMIHAGCGKRVHQQLVCPEHGVVARDQIAKGYEVSKGHSIALEPSELAALDAVANDEIAIREFVPASAIDPIFVERSYYLGPDRGGPRAYRLLRDALESAELVAVASYAARGKSYVVMIRPFETGLVMHQLRYADEMKPWTSIELAALPTPTTSELTLAKTLIAQLRHDSFDPADYKDDVKVRVRAMLADKVKTGEAIETVDTPAAPTARHVDLMAALRASLAGPTAAANAAPRTKSARSRTARPHAARPHPRKRASGHRASRAA